MTIFLTSLAALLIAFVVTARLASAIARTSPLVRRNYRGLHIAGSAGVAVVVGALCGIAWVPILRLLAPDARALVQPLVQGLLALAAALGFALLGLWDDVAGGAGERGWRAHVRSLGTRAPSSGAVKLVAGVLLALVVTSARGERPVWTLVGAAIVAMSANLWNLLDVRPGRASKWFLVAAVPMLLLGGGTAPVLAAGIGAVLAFLPSDLRERAMLGDAGANAIGAIVGSAIVFNASHPVEIGVVVVLGALHVAADRPGLSRLIAAVPQLRRFDALGRVPEDGVPATTARSASV